MESMTIDKTPRGRLAVWAKAQGSSKRAAQLLDITTQTLRMILLGIQKVPSTRVAVAIEEHMDIAPREWVEAAR